ncbi:MAG: 16S rRNA (cytosine(1402)-N(4))-methyltransferase RsmH [Oscillospiraceae bacterium]|nr:16S rRNA (cytosine(1402)-N(4))-methyltransferase RsmH [Oscillospiraceae bacterium]
MNIKTFSHKSVLLRECIDGLNIKPDGIYIDATVGGAGHSCEIAKQLKGGKLFAFDKDPDAVEVAKDKLAGYSAKVINENFKEMEFELKNRGIFSVDGVLIDLGVSSYQLDNEKRGFSYLHEGALDMRMSKQGKTAADIVNTYTQKELMDILKTYGEERFAYKIALNIVKKRTQKPIETTIELADIIKSSIPAKFKRDKNPCKRSFQAIRIAVNRELDDLESGLTAAFNMLNSGGRLVVISFHSLEDRIVKHRYLSFAKGCICPAGAPICICGNKPKARLINKKPIEPSEEEKQCNPRCKSAKLRILEKL